MTPRFARVARLDEIRGDGPHALAADGIDLVALRAGGALRVFEGRCPHQGALLAEGELEDGTLVCRNHRWRFDPATGNRIGGRECLRACPSEIQDGALWVDVSALGEASQTRARRRVEDLPGPRRLPILGNALQLDVPRLHLVFEEWARTYGPLYTIGVPGIVFVCVSDPELVQAVLRARPTTYRRDPQVEPVFAELGVSGVFSAEGAAWRSQRRLAVEGLSQRNVRRSYATLRDVAERLHRRWERAAATGEAVDIQDDLMRFTVDVTTALVFGKDLQTIDGGEDVIQRHLALIFPTFARRLDAVFPYWRYFRLPRDRRVDQAVAAVRAWIGQLIAEARARLAAEPGRPPATFLEAMLTATDEEGRPFTDEVVYGNAMTMLLAGEDTTANSLAWAVHLLCDHPAEVAALRAEIDAVLGGSSVPESLEHANRLDRATAVSNEAMRLLPVAPLNFVQANHDTVLGDVAIPRGTGVLAIHRIAATDERRFTDATRFEPARWLPDFQGAHDPSAAMPFGTGPRICPGRALALIEMRVVLATLYGSFDVERVGRAEDVTERYSFTVMPENLRVRLHPRC